MLQKKSTVVCLLSTGCRDVFVCALIGRLCRQFHVITGHGRLTKQATYSKESISYMTGISNNQPPAWQYANENGTLVTRDWRKSITTKLVPLSTKRATFPSSTSPKPTTRPTPGSTTVRTIPTHQTTTIGNVHLRRSTTVTVPVPVTDGPPSTKRHNTGDRSTTVGGSPPVITKAPTLVTDGKRDKGTLDAMAASESAPIVQVSSVLTAFVSVALLLVFTNY
ncbi:hypothetical protein NP493_128g00010 [Ridgeia piscesae]|uniref:Uncharacterized protein n=1 Tax=Ridgeia piscesae TaxID=27915 RepID=A0AAD9P5K7_RIDPI|nr:hypothetical protein NP493_128g00010 [Ridgeia piscesae]